MRTGFDEVVPGGMVYRSPVSSATAMRTMSSITAGDAPAFSLFRRVMGVSPAMCRCLMWVVRNIECLRFVKVSALREVRTTGMKYLFSMAAVEWRLVSKWLRNMNQTTW
jgi:hypothetical protein